MSIRVTLPAAPAALAAVAALCAACGGYSASDVRTARTSRYTCDYAEVLNAARAGVEEVFPPLGPVDPQSGTVTSEYRWYEHDGTRKQKGMAEVSDRALSIAARVQLREKDGGYLVLTHADVNMIRANMSAAQPLAPDSPDRPKWVQGKLDKLAVEIHGRLKGCAVPHDAPVPGAADPEASPSPTPANPFEGGEPTDPTDPADPAEPTDPTDPAEPAPTNPF
jgi:hypothetical protein